MPPRKRDGLKFEKTKSGQTVIRLGHVVFQDPRSKDFATWQGPTVAELANDAAMDLVMADADEYRAITIRPKAQDVELLDTLARLFGESRNEFGCKLLGAALRDALRALPDDIRRRAQAETFKRLGWTVASGAVSTEAPATPPESVGSGPAAPGGGDDSAPGS